MWFYVLAAVVLIGFVIWFVRTNAFRHHRRGNGTDPGQGGSYRAM